MNTHKPDPSQPIAIEGLEPIAQAEKVACVCNPETGTTCMLHYEMDRAIFANALRKLTEEK